MAGMTTREPAVGYLDTLCEFATGLSYAQLSASNVAQAKVVIADTFGAIVAGAPEPEVAALAKRIAGNGNSSVIGTGSSGLASFTWERVRDEAIQRLAKRVFVSEDPALTAMPPKLRPARVKLRLRDGRTLEGAADANRGDDQDPYSREELAAKFFELAARVWDPAKAKAIRHRD